MNPLQQLATCGQSPWLDYLRRSLIQKGELRTLIERDGLKGVTSNPSIFEKAIDESDDYADALKQYLKGADHGVSEIYEHLAIADIQAAADVLRPVYDQTQRRDGYVSLECSPYLANDTKATIAEATRLWAAVNRPNLMVKVPATPAGIPAIRELIGRGHQHQHHPAVCSERLRGRGRSLYLRPGRFGARRRRRLQDRKCRQLFVSRIDTAVDKRLDKLGDKGRGRPVARQGRDRQREAGLRALQGAVLRPALAKTGGGRRQDPAPALGLHQHQKSGLQGYIICRGADRP